MAAVKGIARLRALAGQAKPSPQIGQALGPLGVNMMEFCKQFNAKTETFKETALMRVKLVAYEDKTFKFTVLPPPSSWFIKRCAGITKGAGSPGKETAGTVSLKSLYEIAKVKQQYDPTQTIVPIEGVVRGLCGVAKSMGLKLSR